jgi:hypothetical protein
VIGRGPKIRTSGESFLSTTEPTVGVPGNAPRRPEVDGYLGGRRY